MRMAKLVDFQLERWMMPRDREVIVSVYRHGILNSKQIEYIHFRENKNSKVISLRRLKKMVDGGYLEQHWFGWQKGASMQHFTITNKGAMIVALSTDIDISRIKIYERHDMQYIEHSLAIADFHKNALKAGLTLQDFTSDYLNKVEFYQKTKRYMIEPDGKGIIKGNNTYPFLMELDRGSMAYDRVLEKVLKYERYHLSAESKKEFTSFPIVIISTSDIFRMGKLKRLIEDSKKTSIDFLFTHMHNTENKFYLAGKEAPVAL